MFFSVSWPWPLAAEFLLLGLQAITVAVVAAVGAGPVVVEPGVVELAGEALVGAVLAAVELVVGELEEAPQIST